MKRFLEINENNLIKRQSDLWNAIHEISEIVPKWNYQFALFIKFEQLLVEIGQIGIT